MQNYLLGGFTSYRIGRGGGGSTDIANFCFFKTMTEIYGLGMKKTKEEVESFKQNRQVEQ